MLSTKRDFCTLCLYLRGKSALGVGVRVKDRVRVTVSVRIRRSHNVIKHIER